MSVLLMALALTGADCDAMQEAYDRFLRTDATYTRHMETTINGEMVFRAGERVSWRDRRLEIDEVLYQETFGDSDGDVDIGDAPLYDLDVSCRDAEYDRGRLRLEIDEDIEEEAVGLAYGEFEVTEVDGRWELTPIELVVYVDMEIFWVFDFEMIMTFEIMDYAPLPDA